MRKDLSIFVFVDALGWEVLGRRQFLDDVLSVRVPLETVLGYSATCIPTILTGRMPREHGHFSFFCRPPEQSPFRAARLLSWLPQAISRRGRVRRWISRAVGSALGYTGYFQLYNVPFRHLSLFDYSEKRDIYQPGGIISGAPTIFDFLREHHVPFHLSDWRRSEGDNLAALEHDIEGGDIRFAYLYLASLDGIMHDDGPGSARAEQHLAWYEERLRQVVALARRHYRDVSLTVFSDHGMARVQESYNLVSRVEQLGFTMGRDFIAMYDSTMARFWFMDDRAEQQIRWLLEGDEKGRILRDDELAAFGCDFEDRRYGELIFLVKPGVLLCPSFMGETPLGGMHGYDPADAASTAAFASSHPPARLPRRLDDLYAVMRDAALEPVGAEALPA